MNCKRYTITVRGEDDGSIEEGFEEARRLIQDGCYAGHNSNDTGAFYFTVTGDVEKGEWPA